MQTTKSKSSPTILVTGGAGFIGTHLINALLNHHHRARIDVVDNLANSSLPDRRRAFFAAHGITFFQQAVAEFVVPSDRRYEFIYHLASPVGPAGVLKYAGRMGSIILDDALKMADLALAQDAKLLTISTSEVYGQNPLNDQPQPEDLPKIVPAQTTVRLEYGVGKLLMEIALTNLAKESPLRVNFIRPFNIVGPYQNGEAGFVLPRFAQAAVRGEAVTVFGDGLQRRTFTHAADIVGAILLVMESPLTGKIYNVGNPVNICSIKDLAYKVVSTANSKSEICCVDPKLIYGDRYAEAWNKIPDIKSIQTDLGWQPSYSLDAIVKEYIAFVRGEVEVLNPIIASQLTE